MTAQMPTLAEMRDDITPAQMLELVDDLFVAAAVCGARNEPPEPMLVVDLACVRDDDELPEELRDQASALLAVVLALN